MTTDKNNEKQNFTWTHNKLFCSIYIEQLYKELDSELLHFASLSRHPRPRCVSWRLQTHGKYSQCGNSWLKMYSKKTHGLTMHTKIPVILGWGLPVVILIRDRGEAGVGIREWHCKLWILTKVWNASELTSTFPLPLNIEKSTEITTTHVSNFF